jgi:hypothetical protein
MADPGFTVPDEFSEAYEIARTLEVHSKARQHYRIEIVRVLRGKTHEFCAHYSENVNDVWTTPIGVGSVHADDLDFATHQALGWLSVYANAHRGDGH